MIYTTDKQVKFPDTTIKITRDNLNKVILSKGTENEIKIEEVADVFKDPNEAFETFLNLLKPFEFWFNAVLP